jgi:hypothetical protein
MPHTNHARDRFLLPFVALLLVGSVSWAADSPMTLSVRPPVVFAGRDVRATVRTPRDPRTREPRVVIEAPGYYASSDVQLDGRNETATRCVALLGLDDSADTFPAPLRRWAPAEPAAIRAGC